MSRQTKPNLTPAKSNRPQPRVNLPLPFKISLALTVVIAVEIAIVYLRLQPELPIFYSLAEAEKQLAPKAYIWLLPSFSLLLNLLHFGLTRVFKQLETMILNIFSWSTVLLQTILFLTVTRIILIIL